MKPTNFHAVSLTSGLLFLALGGFPPVCQGQESTPAMFPFVMNWDDATPGTATDVSFLNTKPAGVNGRVVVKNGHFVEANTGRRVRFMGVNFTFEYNFPSHSDATKIAAHLAKLGFNIVRIHHHDYNSGMLWDKTVPGHQKLNADTMDKLDFLIAELKKNGIYTNLNLHVSRGFEPADGFPDSVNRLPERFSKRVDKFDRRMIQLQKDFARDYLTHVNPYTGLNYTEDPCVAVVEINNENSLVGWGTQDSYFDRLPEPFRGDIVIRWNDWLAKQYRNEKAMLASWSEPEKTANPGTDPRLADSKWYFESRLPAATMKPEEIAGQEFPNAEIYTPEVPPEPWHIQAQITPLNFEDGKTYVATFKAKADKDRIIRVQSSVLGGDWHNVGLNYAAPLTTEWREFRYPFRTNKPLENNNRVSFVVGNDTGMVWLNDVRIQPANDTLLVPTHYSLALKNIDLPSGTIARQSADWMRFLAETERAYGDEMRQYLREDLKVKANLVDTQMSFGGLSSFYREADSDFMDEHAYHEHPAFKGSTWNPANWTINQVSMVRGIGKGSAYAMNALALGRGAGKPYAVSEWNVPAPNDFQVETMPIVASYAALQDWDALYYFDYGAYGENKKKDKIDGFFALAGNPVKEGFISSAALIFRTAKIEPLQATSTLKLDPSAPLRAGSIREAWKKANGGQVPGLLEARMQVSIDPTAKDSVIVNQAAPSPENSSARMIESPAGPQYVAEGEGAVSISGYVGGQKVQTKHITFAFPAFGNNYAGLTLGSVQDPSIQKSRRLLLTIGGKAENFDMRWNADRTSIGNNWGHGPAQAEGIPGTISIDNKLVKHVWALDPNGIRVKELPVTLEGGGLTFTIGPEYRTLHYEIAE